MLCRVGLVVTSCPANICTLTMRQATIVTIVFLLETRATLESCPASSGLGPQRGWKVYRVFLIPSSLSCLKPLLDFRAHRLLNATDPVICNVLHGCKCPTLDRWWQVIDHTKTIRWWVPCFRFLLATQTVPIRVIVCGASGVTFAQVELHR